MSYILDRLINQLLSLPCDNTMTRCIFMFTKYDVINQCQHMMLMCDDVNILCVKYCVLEFNKRTEGVYLMYSAPSLIRHCWF